MKLDAGDFPQNSMSLCNKPLSDHLRPLYEYRGASLLSHPESAGRAASLLIVVTLPCGFAEGCKCGP